MSTPANSTWTKPRVVGAYVWLGLGLFFLVTALIQPGVTTKVILAIPVLMVTIGGLGAIGNGAYRAAKDAAPGTVRVETVKSFNVNGMLSKYQNNGWDLVNQSSAKSIGRETQVTMTFKKVSPSS